MTSRSLGHRAPLLWLVLPLMAGLAAGKAGDFLPVLWLLAGAALASALGIAAGWRGWRWIWAAALTVAMMFAGAAIRQFFVMRHGFKLGRNTHPWPYAATGIVVILALLVWLKPLPVASSLVSAAPAATGAAGLPGGPISYKTLQPILEQRCYLCHGPLVQMKNVRLDSAQGVASHAQMLYQQAVVTRIMPMNNATGISEAERALIKQWFESGAHTE